MSELIDAVKNNDIENVRILLTENEFVLILEIISLVIWSISSCLLWYESDTWVRIWINDGNQINFIEITGTITHDGSQFSKLNISPE